MTRPLRRARFVMIAGRNTTCDRCCTPIKPGTPIIRRNNGYVHALCDE